MRRLKRKTEVTLPQVIAMADSQVATRVLQGYRTEDEFREGEYLHISDLVGKCTRQMAICKAEAIPMQSRTIYLNQHIVFAQGNAIHTLIQNIFKQKYVHVYGTWKCPCSTNVYVGSQPEALKQDVCSVCGFAPINYHEYRIESEEYKTVGHVDLNVMVGTHHYLIELKSKEGEKFDKLQRAEPDHIEQVTLYWWLSYLGGMKLYDQISVVYISKKYNFGKCFKEFVVKINPNKMPATIRQRLDEAKLIRNVRDTGILPARMCSGPDYKMAKTCPQAATCFAVNDRLDVKSVSPPKTLKRRTRFAR